MLNPPLLFRQFSGLQADSPARTVLPLHAVQVNFGDREMLSPPVDTAAPVRGARPAPTTKRRPATLPGMSRVCGTDRRTPNARSRSLPRRKRPEFSTDHTIRTDGHPRKRGETLSAASFNPTHRVVERCRLQVSLAGRQLHQLDPVLLRQFPRLSIEYVSHKDRLDVARTQCLRSFNLQQCPIFHRLVSPG